MGVRMKRPFCENPDCQYFKIKVADDVFRISDMDRRIIRKLYSDQKGRKQFLCESCYLKAEGKDD